MNELLTAEDVTFIDVTEEKVNDVVFRWNGMSVNLGIKDTSKASGLITRRIYSSPTWSGAHPFVIINHKRVPLNLKLSIEVWDTLFLVAESESGVAS